MACKIFEEIGQPYALDYILGLPRAPVKLMDGSTRPMTPDETLASYKNELIGFSKFVSELRYCYRIAPFMIQYMPGTDLIEHGLAAGDLSKEEIERIKEGIHSNYMAEGSVSIAPKKLRLLQGYRVMLRLMSFLSPPFKKMLLKFKLYQIFWMAPFRDKDATTYVKHFLWWFKKRFDKNYHLFIFKKRKRFEVLEKFFELPKNGVLGKKTNTGWTPTDTSVELSVRNDSVRNDSVGERHHEHSYWPELRGFKETETTPK